MKTTITRAPSGLALLLLVLLPLLALAGAARADTYNSMQWREVLERAEEAMDAGDDRAAVESLRELAKDDSERAAKIVTKMLTRFADSVRVYRALDEVLKSFKSEKALKALQEQVTAASSWKVRVLLLDGLARRKALPFATLVKALSDKEDEVQLAAVAQLGQLKTKDAAIALCDFMARIESKGGARGVAWQAARNVLERLLGVEREGGQDFKNYLEENGSRFVDGRGIGGAGARGPRGAGAHEGREKPGETTIFGQPIHCKNVVLILDVSGSMEVPDPLPEGPGTVMRDPTAGEVDESRRRINRAKAELIRVLDELAKRQAKVNIVAYSTDVTFWKPEGLHALGAESLRSAHKFVDGFKADGVTCTDTAIELAFANIPEADCFYLLSDGFATHDGTTKVPTKLILDRVRELNRLRHVQINTLGFVSPFPGAPSADRELMQALADLTGGTYSEIR